jgi:archaemetzincin
MRRLLFAACLAALPARAAAGGGQDSPPRAPARPRVCLVPLGPHDRALIRPILRGMEELYGLDVSVRPALPLPAAAYYPPRRRYRAEKLLAFLDERVQPGSCDFLIGFTQVDISTTKDEHEDWGILGLAWVGGPSGVVSSHRLGRRASRELQAMRAVKVTNHELGHALGLEHHERAGCLMEDAGGTVKTVDRESGLLCDESRRALEEKMGFALPALLRFNWRRVLE